MADLSRNGNGKNGEVIFRPSKIQEYAAEVILDRYENKDIGRETGIAELDYQTGGDFLPMRPGELVGVLGYTSNYKSGFMSYVMRHHATLLRKAYEAKEHNFIVVSVLWEQSIEEQAIVDIAQITHLDSTKVMSGSITDHELKELQRGAIERGKLPWWLVGHSIKSKSRRPRLSMTEVEHSFYRIKEAGFEPVLISLDYLQRIRREKRDMREGFMDIVDSSKDLALAYHSPTLLGCQAKRDVQRRGWRLPQKDDAQETSNFEQSVDKLISLWMPKNDYPSGSELEYADRTYTVYERMLLLSILKQKFGKAPTLYEFNVNPQLNEIYSAANEDGIPAWINR